MSCENVRKEKQMSIQYQFIYLKEKLVIGNYVYVSVNQIHFLHSFTFTYTRIMEIVISFNLSMKNIVFNIIREC